MTFAVKSLFFGFENDLKEKILGTNAEERELATRVTKLDDVLSSLRDKLRLGHSLTGDELQGVLA